MINIQRKVETDFEARVSLFTTESLIFEVKGQNVHQAVKQKSF